MAKKKTRKNAPNKKGAARANAMPSRAFRHMQHPSFDEASRLLATAASVRELWVAHNILRPVFDSVPKPVSSEKVLGRRPSESEYAAMVWHYLEDEFGHDEGWSEVVHNRELVAEALHLGIEPRAFAEWVDANHRTVASMVEPEEGNVLVWRYAEWDSKDDWAAGADWHTAMYNTNRADIISIGGFGGFVTYQEVEVPIGSNEHTSAQTNARIGRP